jgi:hypothetical protein
MNRLPQPRYRRDGSDPAWLDFAVRFHGHLGPWAVAGTRLGMAGRQAVDAGGYFDVEVTCDGPLQRPPQSCFLDGLQLATGATLGKRNLHWMASDTLVVRISNTRTGQQAEVRPTDALSAMLVSLKPPGKVGPRHGVDDPRPADPLQDHLEAIARKIAALSDGEILTVTRPTDL